MKIEFWLTETKVINLQFIPRYIFKFDCYTNGAVKNKDKCFDFNLHFLGIFFSYTDFNYNNQ